MTTITCDKCGQKVQGRGVKLEGVGYHTNNSGILLPQSLMSHDFCTPECFWDWTASQLIDAKVVGKLKSR